MKWIHLADFLYETEGFEETIEICKKTLKTHGSSSEIWNNLGMAYYRTGKIKLAISFLNKAIEEYPKFMKGFGNLAIIYFEQGDYGSALECCYKNIEIDITERKFYSQKAIKIKNDIKKNFIDFSKTNPEDLNSKFKLAEIYYNEDEFTKALQIFNDIVLKNSKHIEALVYKGKIHFVREEYDRAISTYNIALNIEPDNATILYNLGLTYNYQMNYEKAEKVLKKASEIALDDVKIRHYLTVSRLNLMSPNLKTGSDGLVLDEKLKKYYGELIISYFHKDYILPMISANRENPEFIELAQNYLLKPNFEYEIFSGLEAFKQLILKNISDTQTLFRFISPVIFPDFVSYVTEFAYRKKDAQFDLTSQWDMSIYGEILPKIIGLGNVQFRYPMFSGTFFGMLKDDKELILAPISDNLDNLLSLKTNSPEIIDFYKDVIIPVNNGQSRPIQ